MLYRSNKKVPNNVRRILPKRAWDIYKKAFDRAYDEYLFLQDRLDSANREEMADRIAWKKVKRKYSLSDFDHRWHLRT